ncbi:hypothetical protein Q2T41_04890 [Maribacter confluentis]|uniref:Uncharacterized protein n=1 Tax=Maribacter confluentis TaxID=1656093 RepID=A0ABT8RM69_9FLAO|nr:hypothetical protein [Maribacter confluentis]MDO1511999.1 hypothetical protein [Maribacter confluentis]
MFAVTAEGVSTFYKWKYGNPENMKMFPEYINIDGVFILAMLTVNISGFYTGNIGRTCSKKYHSSNLLWGENYLLITYKALNYCF